MQHFQVILMHIWLTSITSAGTGIRTVVQSMRDGIKGMSDPQAYTELGTLLQHGCTDTGFRNSPLWFE